MPVVQTSFLIYSKSAVFHSRPFIIATICNNKQVTKLGGNTT